MVETLCRSPVLHLPGNEPLTLAKVRHATTLVLSAEAELDGVGETVGIVIGPESGAVSEKLVFEAAAASLGIPALYVQATSDLVMGDLLKTMRSSQIFSVSGLPDVALHRLPPEAPGEPERYQVELLGLDVFDPVERPPTTAMRATCPRGSSTPTGTAWPSMFRRRSSRARPPGTT